MRFRRSITFMKILAQYSLETKLLPAIVVLSSLIPWTTAQARITFNAPPAGLGVPGRRVAGGARINNSCLPEHKKRLTVIVPPSDVGLTTVANPTLFFYVPRTSAPSVELIVYDKNQQYKQTYKPTGKAGVVGIHVTATSLEVGKEYRWYFAVICNPKERSQDQVVDGVIKRIQPQQQLTTKLENATLEERVNLYATSGIWQDSLATLAQLLSTSPNNPEFKADWKALLKVGLAPEAAELVNEPLLEGKEAPQSISRI